MPLSPDPDKQSSNISKLIHEGYPKRQAVAISYQVAGKPKRKKPAKSGKEKTSGY